jgi:hypothetical protein
MYDRRPIEGYLTKRNTFVLNALGLLGIYVGALLGLVAPASDSTTRGFASFLVLTGGMLAAFASLMAGLGSKRTTDIQNLGLLLWAGLVLLFAWQVVSRI